MAGSPQLQLERLPARPADGVEAALELRLPSDVALVDPAVDLLLTQCVPGGASRQVVFRVRVAIAEALTNAIECGNGSDPAKIVAIHADLLPDRIRVSVTDEGPGFDPAQVPDPRTPEVLDSPCGRGLFIIRNLADQVEFNAKGNTIWMTLPRW